MSKTIIVIGCSKKKGTEAAPAEELYLGPNWSTYRKYKSDSVECWALSAKHGIIPSKDVIEPYECLLGKDVHPIEFVSELELSLNLAMMMKGAAEVKVFASKKYYECLANAVHTLQWNKILPYTDTVRHVEGTMLTRRKALREFLESAK